MSLQSFFDWAGRSPQNALFAGSLCIGGGVVVGVAMNFTQPLLRETGEATLPSQLDRTQASLIAEVQVWDGRPEFCANHVEVLSMVAEAIRADRTGGQQCQVVSESNAWRGTVLDVSCVMPSSPEACREMYFGQVWIERAHASTAAYQVLGQGRQQRRCGDGVFESRLQKASIAARANRGENRAGYR